MRLFSLFVILCWLPFSGFAENADDFLSFQIIQDQIIFDNTVVQKASLYIKDNTGFAGLLIELKPHIADSFAHMTEAGVTKTANIVLNKKIVSSAVIHTALGKTILITGLTKEEAEHFLISLRDNEPK
jgi:preprotein translocase subunit SecD